MREVMSQLDFSVFAQMSLVLFGGVFVAVLVRVARAPRQEVDTFSRMAMDHEEAETVVAQRDTIAGGRR
jgi:hypothetical protein